MRLIALVFLAALAGCARAVAPAPQQSPDAWEGEIVRFESMDRADPPVPGGVVFVGSSSIRLWSSLAADFPGVRVVNRGFGGSQLADAVRHARRIVAPHRPRLVVLYAGDNDLAAGKSPAQVIADLRAFVAIVRRELPATPVAFIAVKPSLARWALIDRIRETNDLVQRYAREDPLVRYLDVFTPMLDSAGRPRPELLQSDGLHLTSAGYAVWRSVVAPALR